MKSSPDHFAPLPGIELSFISTLIVLAGAGGMAISFAFLASKHPLDVISGVAGFVAGAVMLSGGLLALAVQSRSLKTSKAALHVVGCLIGLVPPMVAVMAWPIVVFLVFTSLPLGLLLVPLFLFFMSLWAWNTSKVVSDHISALCQAPINSLMRHVVFGLQVIAILVAPVVMIYLLLFVEMMGVQLFPAWP